MLITKFTRQNLWNKDVGISVHSHVSHSDTFLAHSSRALPIFAFTEVCDPLHLSGEGTGNVHRPECAVHVVRTRSHAQEELQGMQRTTGQREGTAKTMSASNSKSSPLRFSMQAGTHLTINTKTALWLAVFHRGGHVPLQPCVSTFRTVNKRLRIAHSVCTWFEGNGAL